MSKAGIQSNRGDGYQILIAFDWALTVLSDPDYQWLEVDSVMRPVDDVVVGKSDGTEICCQCKKNHPLHKAWHVADLADELRKASSLLTNNQTALVRFYSRSSFGGLAALREYSANYADELTYHANLGKAQRETDTELRNLLATHAPNLSTYQFLQRTAFETSPELDRMATLLRERLRNLASNHSAAYDALWTSLDQLGMRLNGNGQSSAVKHRLSKDDLKALLTTAGSILTPPMDVREVHTSFKGTSAIGRSWRRDVGNERISSPSVNELIEAIEAKHCSILLTGLPGSGKTCVMLAVQDALEQRARTRTNLLPLFIQSREFADLATAKDREAQGLSAQWVEKVARMAEDAHVVVMIDSLDVLSIAREHSVLTYFLAQIDRLLQIPNTTVVTACRDFDRHYDRRIAQRHWDRIITCQPFDWNTEIAPLLDKLGIDASTTDATTRELVRNPRELALFIELAQQGGSFNVVTSQALAQRYLVAVVQANNTLGDAAMQAIEAMAAEMLEFRSLAVSQQRFIASHDIKRALLSNKVIHEAKDGKLTFGHQTLLDVLVISGAARQAVTLNAFIQGLPPVPFVRPSIRSFVAQLATGDRREFRKQLRAVLTGNNAFHLRRLVAEIYAEQTPHTDDWPLIRDLRSQHREVFQVIYTHAVRPEWHYFWMMYLVPALRASLDEDGLTMHLHRVFQWKNEDATGVLTFWAEVLTLDGIDKTRLANSIAHAMTEVDANHSALCAPLLIELLKLPRLEHSFLGHALARCVTSGGVDDAVLWRYVAGEVCDKDVLEYRFDKKLRCQPQEFGGSKNTFLADRMQKSTVLLDLAVASIEQWSQIKRSHYGETSLSYWSGFLRETSYADAHTEIDLRHLNSERILLDAVEAAIGHHAITQTSWWQSNRERLCFSKEGALRYFAIRACMAAPNANFDVIGRLLCDKTLLESELSHELGTLMQIAFYGLDAPTQDAIQETILAIHHEIMLDSRLGVWMHQAQLILAIPCHLRSPEALTVLKECEKAKWPQVRSPQIRGKGGAIIAPFTFEVFLNTTDEGVLRLLEHYTGYARNSFDDFLVGGERQVGSQLGEASSRCPTRFVNLLSENWEKIADRFRDDIIDGVASCLAYRYGDLRPNDTWTVKEEIDPTALARKILNELEAHSTHWHHNRAASKAIQSCAHVVAQTQDAARLISLAVNFSSLQAESSISGDSVDLLTIGINMARGDAAEALMILANELEENNAPWPELLPDALRLFAADKHPAIRALLLRRMPYLQSRRPDLGWELFDLAMTEFAPGLWPVAEPCLYYAYHQAFEIVSPHLKRLYREGSGKDLRTWGRICALSAFSKQLNFSFFLTELKSMDASEAWRGAASVWTHPGNLQQHWEQCLVGLQAGLNVENAHAVAVGQKFQSIFRETTPLITPPIDLIRHCFCLIEAEGGSDIFDFAAWLNAASLHDPTYALEAAEIYISFIRRAKPFVYDHDNNLTQLLTRLFAQAEEQEESDSGAMLQRVVAMQDALLALGVNGVNEWLKAAERP